MDILLDRMLSLIPKKPNGAYVHGEKKKFCEKIGAPTNIVSEWEAGKTKSYRNYVYTVASIYNVSVEWLRGETDKKEKPAPVSEGEPNEISQRFLPLIEGLTPDQQQLLFTQLEAWSTHNQQPTRDKLYIAARDGMRTEAEADGDVTLPKRTRLREKR